MVPLAPLPQLACQGNQKRFETRNQQRKYHQNMLKLTTISVQWHRSHQENQCLAAMPWHGFAALAGAGSRSLGISWLLWLQKQKDLAGKIAGCEWYFSGLQSPTADPLLIHYEVTMSTEPSSNKNAAAWPWGTPPSPNGAEEVEVEAPEAARWVWTPRRLRDGRRWPMVSHGGGRVIVVAAELRFDIVLLFPSLPSWEP